ncbi:YaeQ family protein [Sodalis-like endosymbiont of Proechinophthirus fluctus]
METTMALKSTGYKATINVADMDCHYYLKPI